MKGRPLDLRPQNRTIQGVRKSFKEVIKTSKIQKENFLMDVNSSENYSNFHKKITTLC